MITYDYFKKIELRVGTVVQAQRVENTDKMLMLKVDIGSDSVDSEHKVIQLLAGMGLSYSVQEIIGKQIIVLTNLEPRTMFKGNESINNGQGLESQGMLLASDGENGPILLTVDKKTFEGATIK